MTMSMTMEKIISHAVLVPIGNGDPMSGPDDPGCLMGLPICWWGLPGIGKSARIKAGARAVGLHTEVVFPSHRQPEDFAGVPVLRPEGGLTIECILGAVRKLLALPPHDDFGVRGLLFIDEVGSARPAVQDALFGAIWDRLIGDTELPPGLRIMLANNPLTVSGGFELKPALANRMGHIDQHPPTWSQWMNWMMGRTKHDVIGSDHGEAAVRSFWPEVFAQAKGVMAGFGHVFGEKYIHELPPQGHADRGRAWPSPRVWDLATRALATCLALDPSMDKSEINVDVINHAKGDESDKKQKTEQKTLSVTAANRMAHVLIEAIVGHAAASDWITWLAEADLPDPETVLNKGWAIERKRLDKTVAVVEACTQYVLSRRSPELKVATAAKYWPFIGQLIKAEFSELAYIAAQDLSMAEPKLDSTHPELATVAAQPTLLLHKNGTARLF